MPARRLLLACICLACRVLHLTQQPGQNRCCNGLPGAVGGGIHSLGSLGSLLAWGCDVLDPSHAGDVKTLLPPSTPVLMMVPWICSVIQQIDPSVSISWEWLHSMMVTELLELLSSDL